MFCSKCGANVSEKARFCAVCGNVIDPNILASMQQHEAAPQPEPQPEPQVVPQPEPQPEPQPQPQPVPQYVPPVQYAPQVPYQQPVSTVKPMGRQKFNYTRGGAMSWVSFVALLIAVILIGICAYNALFGELLDMPLFSMAPEETVQQLEDIMKDGKKASKESWDRVEQFKDEHPDMTDEQEEYITVVEDALEKMDDMLDNLSVMGMYNVINYICSNENFVEAVEMAYGEEKADSDLTQLRDINDVLSVVVIVLAACFGLGMLLTLLAACFRSTVLTVLGLLASYGICMFLGSAPLAMAILVLDILGIVLNVLLRKKYNTYKKAPC